MTDRTPPNSPDTQIAASGRASRCWSAYVASATTILLWKYVSPWAGWGWSGGLLALAMFFDLGFEVRHGR